MMVIRKLHRDENGSSLVEFAIALPVLVAFIWGIFQCGLLFQANAGMQHALGEAARMATIWPTPSDTIIRDRVTAKKFGTYNGSLGTLSITTKTVGDLDGDPDTAAGSGNPVYKDLSLQYTHTMRFLFLPARAVTLTKTKRVYLAS
jgi:Flp pilus assembly protein TadG